MVDLRALAERLRHVEASRYHVVTLPDFYLDHLLRVPSWGEATAAWRAVHDRGGGNVSAPEQRLVPGGNAANTALALARLGVRTHLVTRTSTFGKVFLEQTLGRMGVDLKHVRGDGDLAVSTILEFQAPPSDDVSAPSGHPHNVMLSAAGSVRDFGPDALTPNDWTLVEAADLVLLANWAQNTRGTELVEAVARAAHKAGRRTMLDTGDPSVRPGALPEVAARLMPLRDLAIHALNENELQQLARRHLATEAEQRAAANELHKLRGDNVLDLHTAAYAASYGAWGEAHVPTFDVRPLRVTGAGDSWNAGDILGHLAGLAPEERLTLANAVAALYISSEEGLAPTLADVAAFLESGPRLGR